MALAKKASYGGGALVFMKMMNEGREEDKLARLELAPWSA